MLRIRGKYCRRRSGHGWRAFVGDIVERVSVEQSGASAAYQRLFEEFGITAQQVALAARTSMPRLASAASPMRATSGSNEREWQP
jgi:transketolase